MSNQPKGSHANTHGPCRGSWACDGHSHCACWWDSSDVDSEPCCQCGSTEPLTAHHLEASPHDHH